MQTNTLNHIAFIMDGNGRWATKQGAPRTYGHLKGSESLKEIAKACLEHKIPCVSFFAFSTDNWSRPSLEVNYIMKLVRDNLSNPDVLNWFIKNDVKFVWNGQGENLDSDILLDLKEFMQKTQHCKTMIIQIMFNYSSQLAIVDACNKLINKEEKVTLDSLDRTINKFNLPKLDLLIRTSGEQRISNFMLWELSYAELVFSSRYWPEYTPADLKKDINTYHKRKRRFGGL